MKKERYVWVALVPAIGLLFVTIWASLEKLFHSSPKISFLAHAAKYKDAAARGELLAPAKDIAQMHQIAFNDYVNSGLTALFLSVVVFIGIYGLKVALKARKVAWSTAKEVPAVYRNEVQNNGQQV